MPITRERFLDFLYMRYKLKKLLSSQGNGLIRGCVAQPRPRRPRGLEDVCGPKGGFPQKWTVQRILSLL